MTLAPRRLPAVREVELGAAAFVPHLDLDAVHGLMAAAAASRHGERDALLIALLFDGCLRVSEALGLRPVDLVRGEGGWSARIVGKGRKPGQVALSPPRDARLFPVSRTRVLQVVSDAFQAAGIAKPDHVGAVHVLRHSGAIARLDQTGNPKALQDHLRHADARMTLRYLKTTSAKHSLEIQQAVDFQW